MEVTLARLRQLIGEKAPIVGISRPTEKPFAVERARLAVLIEGLEQCEINLKADLEIHTATRHYKLHTLDMQRWTEAYKSLRPWASRQRAKREAPKLSMAEKRKSELLKKIAIAERKARQLSVCRPFNPVLETGETASDYEREQWAGWISQKPLRRKIGRLATTHGLINGYVPSAVIRQPRKLYESAYPSFIQTPTRSPRGIHATCCQVPVFLVLCATRRTPLPKRDSGCPSDEIPGGFFRQK